VLVGLARRDQRPHRAVGKPLVVERRFQIVVVEPDAECGEIRVLFATQYRHGETADRVQVVDSAVAGMRGGIIARDLPDVFALIAVVGKAGGDALRFPDPRLHRQGQIHDLRTGVVVIELAMNGEALRGEQPRDRIADGRTAAVPDMQRAGGVGRDEFDDHLFAASLRRAAVAVAFVQNPRYDRLPRGVGDEQIDESRAGDFGAREQRRSRQRRHEVGRQLARIAFQRLAELQRRVGRIIAVPGLLRPLEHDRRRRRTRGDAGDAFGEHRRQFCFELSQGRVAGANCEL
jgi:hypothetical protein